MKLNKDDIYGIVGSVAFHLFILLILGFTVLKTVVPDEDGGILVKLRKCQCGSRDFRTEIYRTGTSTRNDDSSPSRSGTEGRNS